ncbi:apoptosis-associated speck-like protein containing a CARD isoform X1 [Larimichthys crocea]|uniref:apoptosis-associated speck-like protein containing a CARD isoform X1 n=1 Tax=Larimichthys crocea TaxID=215358 RepID=UPI00090199A3|nr:apoptosis-associated speck-like protein containing a CARD isoform X1 [Larimichthys crocea]
MAPKTKRRCIADALEDLEPEHLEKFRHQLLDRKGESRVRRAMVKDKNYMDLADVLVSTFTEDGAVKVTEELLKEIGCLGAAKDLVEDVSAQSAKPGSGSTDADVKDMSAQSASAHSGSCDGDGDEHFVDKHQLELINRVGNVAPILDYLLIKKVIQQEMYDEIRKLPTTQKMMREIFSRCLKAGKACKDIFYESLEKNERFLIDDLKNKK